MRYSNFSMILNVIEAYMDRYQGNANLRLEPSLIIKQININDLLDHVKEQQYLLSEIFILLTAMSSRVDSFLVKIDSEEQIGSVYTHILEKYITSSGNKRNLDDESKSNINLNNYMNVYKKNLELKNERYKLLDQIKEINGQLFLLKENLFETEKINYELELKLNDKINELDFIKNNYNTKDEIDLEELLLRKESKINDLYLIIKQKDTDLENFKKDHELDIKQFNEKISKLEERLFETKDKFDEIDNLKIDNDKLKKKIKELNVYKENQLNYEQLDDVIESKQRIIDTLKIDIQKYVTQLEKKIKEINSEKDKYRNLYEQKQILEEEIRELHLKLENFTKTFVDHNLSINESRIEMNVLGNIVNETSINFNCAYDNQKEEKIKSLENENENLKKENLKLIKKTNCDGIYDYERDEEIKNLEIGTEELKHEIEDLNKKIYQISCEKNNLIYECEQKDLENKQLIHERDKILIEKEKISLEIQKIDLHMKKMDLESINEKNKLEKDSVYKMKKLLDENSSLVRENEILKNQNEKNLKEKIEIEKITQNYEKEIAYLKLKLKKLNAYSIKEPNAISNDEMSLIRSEIQNLKITLQQRDDLIKTLQGKIITLENENDECKKNFQDSVENFEKDIKKRSDDFEFIKRSYEEQKSRVNKEHELISNSLYDLALQFMTLKNELQKKVTDYPKK